MSYSSRVAEMHSGILPCGAPHGLCLKIAFSPRVKRRIFPIYLQMLVLDEADQCLSMGFADTMNCILEELPSERQTMLFSATQTR